MERNEKTTRRLTTSRQLRKMIFFSGFFLFLVLSSFTCDDCETYQDFEFELSLGNQFITSEYRVGDTIRMFKTISSDLLLTDGSQFDNSLKPFRVHFDMYRIPSNNGKVVDGIDYFDIETKQGNFDRFESTLFSPISSRLEFNCSGGDCIVDINLVCLEEGYYGFATLNGNFGDFEDNECATYEVIPDLASGISNNFQLLQEIDTDMLILELNNSDFNYTDITASNQSYFFKVVP